MPAPHPPEFRRRAVELARGQTKPVAELAKDLGISQSCLRNWMAQADVDENGGGNATRLSSSEKKELVELRRKNRQLEMENEILKRAAGYCACPVPDITNGKAARSRFVIRRTSCC